MNKNIWSIITIILLLVIILGAGVYFLAGTYIQQKEVISVTPTPGFTVTLDSTPSPIPTERQTIPEDWETYEHEDPDFSIDFPSNMEIINPETGVVNFNLIGNTQTTDTELFDGISFSINTGTYDSGSFQDFVEQEYSDQENQPTTSEISDLLSTIIAGRQAYTYEVFSLGQYTHIYLPHGDKGYIHIYYIAPDPENQGYQDTVDTMINSLEI